MKVEISKFRPFLEYMVMKGGFNVTTKLQNYAFIISIIITIIIVNNSCFSFRSLR
jgi:hypothetical protein